MAWRRTGNKLSPTPMMTQFTDTYMCHKALMYKSTRRRKVLVLTANNKQHHGDLPLYRSSNTHRKFRKKLTWSNTHFGKECHSFLSTFHKKRNTMLWYIHMNSRLQGAHLLLVGHDVSQCMLNTQITNRMSSQKSRKLVIYDPKKFTAILATKMVFMCITVLENVST